MTRWVQIGIQCVPAILLLGIWQILVSVFPRYEFFLGSPRGIVREFGVLWREADLPIHVLVTAVEAVLGFIAGSVFGTVVGLAMWMFRGVYLVSRPYLIALGVVPVFALGPVLVFWVGTGLWSKVAIGFLSTFVVAVVQAHTGATEADTNLLRMVKAFGGTRRQAFVKVIVPSATVWVLSGIRLNIGMALLGAFVGEFISSRQGLGHLIIVAEGLYNVNQIWVGTGCLIAIALVFYSCTTPVERWAKRGR